MKVFVTYGEILETTAVRIFNKLRSDPELRNNENIFFYRPKKKELFEYIYQTKLADLLVKEGLLTSEYAKKLARGDRIGTDGWKELKKEWLSLWRECFGVKRLIIIPLDKPLFWHKLKLPNPVKTKKLLRCVQVAHEETVKTLDKEFKRKARNYDIFVELHSSLSNPKAKEGAVGAFISKACPHLIEKLVKREVAYILRSQDFPTITLEIHSKPSPSQISAWIFPRLLFPSFEAVSLYQRRIQLMSKEAVRIAYPKVKRIIKLLASA